MVSAARQSLESSDRVADPLYKVDDIVRMPDHSIAIIERVHRSIATLPKYNVIDEDGKRHDYVAEYELYPHIIPARK